MSTVVGFKGKVPEGQPVPEIVKVLEDLLSRAKGGELQSLAYAATLAGSSGVAAGWDGNAGTRDALGAALSYLHHRYYQRAYE